MRKFTIGLLLCVWASVARAQACPAIVETALNAVDQFCTSATRNQACYGNIAIDTEAQPDATNFTFEQVGDVVNVRDIASMKLAPMNEADGTWGVAIMRLQANLPDTLAGQTVTFLLFGDAELVPDTEVASDDHPMRAFYLRTGIGDAPCAEAPASGLIIQTPKGARNVSFNVNGVEIGMGSTILFRAKPAEEMTVSALEGSAVMVIDGALFPIVAGTWARLPVDEDMNAVGAPPLPVAYKSEVLSALPVRVLDRQIDVRPPLDEEELRTLHELLRQGIAPCGDEAGLFPACDALPFFSDLETGERGLAWAQEGVWGLPVDNHPPAPSEDSTGSRGDDDSGDDGDD
jgi:hypothetical protein